LNKKRQLLRESFEELHLKEESISNKETEIHEVQKKTEERAQAVKDSGV